MFREWDAVVVSDTLHTTRSFFNYFYGTVDRIDKFDKSDEHFQLWIDGQYQRSPYMEFYQASDITLQGTKKRVYEYAVSIPFLSTAKTLGSVHVWLDENSLKTIMSPSGAGGQEFSYIADTRGNIISFFSDKYSELPKEHKLIGNNGQSGYFTENTGTGKNEIYYTHSRDGKWIFVTAQSLESVLGRVNKTRNLFLSIFAGSIFLALVISLFLSWRKAHPLSSIMDSLREYSLSTVKGGNGREGQLRTLQRSVMTLISENSAIRGEMERQQPILQNVFLSRLLKGEISDEDEIRENIMRMRIETAGRNFIVILAFFKQSETGDDASSFSGARAVKAVLLKTVQSGSRDIYFLPADLDENTIAFIDIAPFFDPDDYMRRCADFFTSIRNKLSEEYFVLINFTIGQPTDVFSRLYCSFDTAKQVQENNLLRGKTAGVSVFDTGKKDKIRYDYSIGVESRLVNFVREGDINGIRTVLNYLFETCNTDVLMDNESLKLFLGAIKNTLIRVNTMMFSGDPRLYSDFDKTIISVELFDRENITKIFEDICRIIRKKQDSLEPKLKENVIKYTHENYRSKDFYLGSLSDHFKLSEAYLSLFFKECTGENFIAYVERLRLGDACDLLRDFSISIETIASSSGYSSSHAFRRAFKRRFGISPTEYRRRNYN
jgi:AraC-like DNA-binding protein